MEYGDITATLEIKLWPFQYLIAVMLVVTGVVHIWLATRAARADRAARLEGEAA